MFTLYVTTNETDRSDAGGVYSGSNTESVVEHMVSMAIFHATRNHRLMPSSQRRVEDHTTAGTHTASETLADIDVAQLTHSGSDNILPAAPRPITKTTELPFQS